MTNSSFFFPTNRLRQTTIDRALLVFKRVGKLAEDENDRVAFKAFQGMLKVVKESRCPRLNAIDDVLCNSPYAMMERSVHDGHVQNVPQYPSVLHDMGTRFVRAMAPRVHVLIARGKSLPLPTQDVAIETIGCILRFLLDMGKRIRADEPSRYESPIDWSISYVQSVLLPMLAPNMVTLPNVMFAACDAIWSIGCSQLMRLKRDEWYPRVVESLLRYMLHGDSIGEEEVDLHDRRHSYVDLGVSACHADEIVERILCCAAYLPRSQFFVLLPSIIRIVGSTTNTPKRHTMMHYIVGLVFEKKNSDCIDRGGRVPLHGANHGNAPGHFIEWGLGGVLEHLFQRTSWLNATVHSSDIRLGTSDPHKEPCAATMRYFREELILTFLLCWYQQYKIGTQSGKRIPSNCLDDAFEILICFHVCLGYLSAAEALVPQSAEDDQDGSIRISECLRSSMVANVYLDVVDICLHNHANNPRLGDFLRAFYNSVVVNMILSRKSGSVGNVLCLDLKLRAISIVLNHFGMFTKGPDATVNLGLKEMRDQFERAIIQLLKGAVSLYSDTLFDSPLDGTQAGGNNLASAGLIKQMPTDHILYSMHRFLATLSLFMKDILAQSRGVVTSPTGENAIFEGVHLITNINDAVHNTVHELEEIERESNAMGSNDRLVHGTKHDHLNLSPSLSSMLRKLIDSTSNALLGATGSPSKNKRNIYNIMNKNSAEQKAPCVGTGKFLSLPPSHFFAASYKFPQSIGALTGLTMILKYVAFYAHNELLPGHLNIFPRATCRPGEYDSTGNAILTYLFELQHYISSLAQDPHPGTPQASRPKSLSIRQFRVEMEESDDEILEEIWQRLLAKGEVIGKAGWIASFRSFPGFNGLGNAIGQRASSYVTLNGSSDPCAVALKYKYFQMSKRLLVSVRIISMMNFQCYGPIHVRLALSNTRVVAVSPSGLQHTFKGTVLQRTSLEWETMLYVERLEDVSVTPLVSISYVKASNGNHDHPEQNSAQGTDAKGKDDGPTDIAQDVDDSPSRVAIACAQHRMSRYELVTRGPQWINRGESFAALWARMNYNIFSCAESYVRIRLDTSRTLV